MSDFIRAPSSRVTTDQLQASRGRVCFGTAPVALCPVVYTGCKPTAECEVSTHVRVN